MEISQLFGMHPRITDLIFALFFPAGLLTFVFNLLIITFSLIIYSIGAVILRKCVKKDKELLIDKAPRRTQNLGFILLTSLIVSPMAVVIFFVILLKAANLCGGQQSPKGKNRKRLLLAPSYFFIIIAPALFSVLFILLGNLVYLSYLLLGCLLGYFYIFRKRLWKVPSRELFRLKSGLKKTVRTTLILIPIVSTLFIGLTYTLRMPLPAPDSPTTLETTELRIMTYNIRLPTIEDNPANNWDVRKPYFVGYLDTFSADIIGIQEAYYRQILYIIGNLKTASYQYFGVGRTDGTFGGEHSAILFRTDKFDLIDGDTFWLSALPTIPSATFGNTILRICTWARLREKHTGAEFFVFNTHYDFSDYFHEHASRLIIERINGITGGLPVFLMGDFNLRTTSHGYQFLEGYGDKPLQDSFNLYHNGTAPFDWTFNRFNASFVPETSSRIDFIFISDHITPLYSVIPKDTYGDNLVYSDHYPVILDCKF